MQGPGQLREWLSVTGLRMLVSVQRLLINLCDRADPLTLHTVGLSISSFQRPCMHAYLHDCEHDCDIILSCHVHPVTALAVHSINCSHQ